MLGDVLVVTRRGSRVGSVITMCMQVVINSYHTYQLTCKVLHTSTKWLKRQGEVWWKRRRGRVTVAAKKRRKLEGQVIEKRQLPVAGQHGRD